MIPDYLLEEEGGVLLYPEIHRQECLWYGVLMRRYLSLFLLLPLSVFSQTVTRLHDYGEADPQLVERQIRAIVPEGPRVSMNTNAKQVIVVAEPALQEKIAAMVAQLSKLPVELQFRLRLNKETVEVSVQEGVLFSVPLTENPPPRVEQVARARLDDRTKDEPIVASGLQFHPVLLREDPVVVRLRVTPVVVFGEFRPYDVIAFAEFAQDMLVTTTEFLNLSTELSSHDFYRSFLTTDTETSSIPKPIGLLLSMETNQKGDEE